MVRSSLIVATGKNRNSEHIITMGDDQMAGLDALMERALDVSEHADAHSGIANDEALFDDDEGDVPRLDVQPPNLEFGTLKGYQLECLNWLIQLYETDINGILADEVYI